MKGGVMTTIVVYEKDSRSVLAAIPIKDGEAGILRKDVEFQIFNGTEPVFEETPNGPILKNNTFIINLEGKDYENQ